MFFLLASEDIFSHGDRVNHLRNNNNKAFQTTRLFKKQKYNHIPWLTIFYKIRNFRFLSFAFKAHCHLASLHLSNSLPLFLHIHIHSKLHYVDIPTVTVRFLCRYYFSPLPRMLFSLCLYSVSFSKQLEFHLSRWNLFQLPTEFLKPINLL